MTASPSSSKNIRKRQQQQLQQNYQQQQKQQQQQQPINYNIRDEVRRKLRETTYAFSFSSVFRWSEDLPSSFLRHLNRVKWNVLTGPAGTATIKCNQMLDMEFQFHSSGYVVNEANMVYPGLSTCKTICATPIVAYFLKVRLRIPGLKEKK